MYIKHGGIFMKRFLAIGLAISICLSLCACAGSGKINANKAAVLIASPEYPDGIASGDYEALSKYRNMNRVSTGGCDALTAFSYNTASPTLSTVEVNGCYSPLSLYYALALAGTGSHGQTQKEIMSLLGSSDTAQLSQDMGNLYRLLYSDNEITKLKIANSLWLDKEYQGVPVEYKDAFIKNAASMFYASLFTVDFASEDAGPAMAKWISEETNGTLTPEFRPDPEQIMSILNTVYFKDEWVDKFEEQETKPDIFYTAESADVTCDFMNMVNGSHAFVRGDGFLRSDLALKSGAKMVFVLPDEGVSVESLVSDPARLKEVLEGGQFTNGKVTWKIPKFSYESDYDLVDMLKTLGLSSAFTSDADFTGISDQEAFISSVTQQTHIAIDENGVEASAFTLIEYATAAMPVDEAEMILDRPFLYAIYSPSVTTVIEAGSTEEIADGRLLFVGICGNPAA